MKTSETVPCGCIWAWEAVLRLPATAAAAAFALARDRASVEPDGAVDHGHIKKSRSRRVGRGASSSGGRPASR